MEKPQNYEPNSGEKLKNQTLQTLPQAFFMFSLIFWILESIYVSVSGFFTNFEHKLLTFSFTITVLLGVYIKVKNMLNQKIKKS